MGASSSAGGSNDFGLLAKASDVSFCSEVFAFLLPGNFSKIFS